MSQQIYTGSPEPRHSTEISCAGSNGDLLLFCASSKGSGESTHFHRLTLAFVTVPKSHTLPQMAIRVLFTPAGRLMSLHICAGIVTGQWRVYTFAQAYLTVDNHVTCGQCANRMLQRILMKNQYILTF